MRLYFFCFLFWWNWRSIICPLRIQKNKSSSSCQQMKTNDHSHTQKTKERKRKKYPRRRNPLLYLDLLCLCFELHHRHPSFSTPYFYSFCVFLVDNSTKVLLQNRFFLFVVILCKKWGVEKVGREKNFFFVPFFVIKRK